MPSLTFVLPHWLYWFGLIVFPAHRRLAGDARARAPSRHASPRCSSRTSSGCWPDTSASIASTFAAPGASSSFRCSSPSSTARARSAKCATTCRGPSPRWNRRRRRSRRRRTRPGAACPAPPNSWRAAKRRSRRAPPNTTSRRASPTAGSRARRRQASCSDCCCWSTPSCCPAPCGAAGRWRRARNRPWSPCPKWRTSTRAASARIRRSPCTRGSPMRSMH